MEHPVPLFEVIAPTGRGGFRPAPQHGGAAAGGGGAVAGGSGKSLKSAATLATAGSSVATSHTNSVERMLGQAPPAPPAVVVPRGENRRSSEPMQRSLSRQESGGRGAGDAKGPGAGGSDCRRLFLAGLKAIRDADKEKARLQAKELTHELQAKERHQERSALRNNSSGSGRSHGSAHRTGSSGLGRSQVPRNDLSGSGRSHGSGFRASSTKSISVADATEEQRQAVLEASARLEASAQLEDAAFVSPAVAVASRGPKHRGVRSAGALAQAPANEAAAAAGPVAKNAALRALERSRARRSSDEKERRPSASAAAQMTAQQASRRGSTGHGDSRPVAPQPRAQAEDSHAAAAAVAAAATGAGEKKRISLAPARRLSGAAPLPEARHRSMEHASAAVRRHSAEHATAAAARHCHSMEHCFRRLSDESEPLPLEAVIEPPRGCVPDLGWERRDRGGRGGGGGLHKSSSSWPLRNVSNKGLGPHSLHVSMPITLESVVAVEEARRIPATVGPRGGAAERRQKEDDDDEDVVDHDLLLLDVLNRQPSKLRQENAIYRERCRSLQSEKNAAVLRVGESEDALLSAREESERLSGELADAKRAELDAAATRWIRDRSREDEQQDREEEESADAEEDDDPASLRRKLRRARQDLQSKNTRLRDAEDEIDRLTRLLRRDDCDDDNNGGGAHGASSSRRAVSSSGEDNENRRAQLRAMEQVAKAKDAALAAAREEAAEMWAKVCGMGESGGAGVGGSGAGAAGGGEAQLKGRLEELERENAWLRKRVGATGRAA